MWRDNFSVFVSGLLEPPKIFFAFWIALVPVCQTKLRPVLRKGLVKELFGSTLKKKLYLKTILLGIREAALL